MVTAVDAVVVELPQMTENDLRSARAARVNHSWYMCVIGHGYGGISGGRDGGGRCCSCWTKPGVGHMR